MASLEERKEKTTKTPATTKGGKILEAKLKGLKLKQYKVNTRLFTLYVFSFFEN